MSNNIKMEDLQPVAPTSEATQSEAKVEETSETKPTAQDPLKNELERVQKTGKTEAEKAAFSLKKNAERAKELGIDPAEILGLKKVATDSDDEDNQPVTLGMLKKLQAETNAKTALQKAEAIENEAERELTKFHLQNTIRSTGNPDEDLKLARALVNSVKNAQIMELSKSKGEAKSHSSASGAPAIKTEVEGDLTPDEVLFTQAPFFLKKEDIIKARQK